MSKTKTKSLTVQELHDLPLGSRITDRDGDEYANFLGPDSRHPLWIDVDSGEGADEIVNYQPITLVEMGAMVPAPATETDLIRMARKVVEAYNEGWESALYDAVLSLSVELSTLPKETT